MSLSREAPGAKGPGLLGLKLKRAQVLGLGV